MTREFYDERLHSMLQHKRPHGSKMELEWAETYLGPYSPAVFGDTKIMAYVIVTDPESKVLFSCHVDTVHREEGKQKVMYDPAKTSYYKKDGKPLGADDGAGCWLMLEMIDARVPGTYIFHRGEECGGIGSSWMAQYAAEWLKTFDYAVAFDRKATDSIITYQGSERCCSDAFADSLAAALNAVEPLFMYSPDDTGVYTDTAEYTSLIPECTNVSCGYYKEHTQDESLDLSHLFALRDACCRIDWSALVVARDPSVKERKQWGGFGSYLGTGTGADTSRNYGDFGVFDAALYEKRLTQMDRWDMLTLVEEDPDYFVTLVHDLINELENSGSIHNLSDDKLRHLN